MVRDSIRTSESRGLHVHGGIRGKKHYNEHESTPKTEEKRMGSEARKKEWRARERNERTMTGASFMI